METLRKAKMKLILNQPFFATMALGMEFVESAVETTRTDGRKVEYNRTYLERQTVDGIVYLICHNVMHVALLHHTRRGNRDKLMWDTACDYAINPLIRAAGIIPLAGALENDRFKNKSAEEIYSMLEKEKRNNPEAYARGGGATNMGEVTEPKDVPLQQAEAEAKAAASVANAIAKQAGKGTSGLEEAIGELLNPKIAWQEALMRFICEVAKNDYNWKQPSKRYIPIGLYLPQLESIEVGKCVFAVDTSISVDTEVCTQFGSELFAIKEMFNFPVTVIHCDTKIHAVEELQDGEFVPKGRGGTDFRPPFEYVNNEMPNIKALIYLTDGDCNRFPEEPAYPTLWVVYNSKRFNPPFGEVLYF